MSESLILKASCTIGSVKTNLVRKTNGTVTLGASTRVLSPQNERDSEGPHGRTILAFRSKTERHSWNEYLNSVKIALRLGEAVDRPLHGTIG